MIYGKTEKGVWHDMVSTDPPVTLCGLALRSPILTNAVPGDNRCKLLAHLPLVQPILRAALATVVARHYYRYEGPRG
jgi:hypothetical protein